MPGIVVSLREALGVREEPLSESDVWAILNQAAVYFQKLGQGNIKGEENFVVTPDSLCFRADGGVTISQSSGPNKEYFVPPELKNSPLDSLLAIEKCYIYSLGRSLVSALEYCKSENQTTGVSRNLERVLCCMCEENSAARISVSQVLQACSLYAERHVEMRNSYLYTKKIYSSIMGSDTSEEENTSGSHSQSSRHIESGRSHRSRGKHKYRRRREQQRSSRSRSRSRSRSNSRRREDYDENFQSQKENYREAKYHPSYTEPPSYFEHVTQSPYGPSARSYHLSDITFTSALNQGGESSHKASSGVGAHMSETTYQKYLRLKERQKKLKVLRVSLMGQGYDDSDPVMVPCLRDFHGADTRSVISSQSFTKGSYDPGLHMQYGSKMALQMGQESDLESLASSEISLPQELRAKDTAHHHGRQQYRTEKINVMGSDEGRLEHLNDELNKKTEEFQKLKKEVKQVSHQNKKERLKQQPGSTQSLASVIKPKEYYGPEFVHKASKPLIRIPIPLQGESLKNPSHVRRVVVVLLTGQKLEAMVDPSITGQQMFESVITHIELPEFFFFGLTYINEGEHFFIEPDMKLHKIAPEGWKDSWKENMPVITLTIYVRMKFYPENITMLRHQISKHLLYLQLRHDILEERTLCSEEECLAMAGFALQAEYGEYDGESMGRNYFMQEHYFPHRIVKRVGNAFIRDHAAEAHERATGLSDRQAELEFIKVGIKLQEYGIHFYRLLKMKNDTNSIMWVGINVKSLLLAENQAGSRALVQQYPWQNIQKISFNKRRFSVQSKPDLGMGKPPKLNYYTNSYRKGRYLLQFSTAQHRFQLSMKSRECNTQPQELTLDSVAQFMCDESMNEDENSSSESQGLATVENDRLTTQPLPYTLPPPYKADTSVSMLDLRQKYLIPFDKKRNRFAASTGDIVREVERQQPTPAYVLGMEDKTLDTLGGLPPNETVNTTLEHRFNDELPSPQRPDRLVFEVSLQKEPDIGIGITIVGGESTGKQDLGIYVKFITPGGPAERDGQIKPGDRILAINSQSLEGVPHYLAVQMIKKSQDVVKMLISQIKPPKSVRRYDDASIESKLRASHASPSDLKIFHQLSKDYDSDQEPFICDYTDHNVADIPQDSHYKDDPSAVSTMSQVDSIQSELMTDLPQDDKVANPDDTDYGMESDPDSDFDEGVQAVVDGRGLDLLKLEDAIRPAELSEWSRIESVPSVRPLTTQSEVLDVILNKTETGFGLNVTGGKNTSVKHGGIYVKSILAQSSAALEGTIQPGDRIMAVGQIPLKSVTHKQAVEIIQNAPDICTFVIERGSLSTSAHSSVKSNNSSKHSYDMKNIQGDHEKESSPIENMAAFKLRDEEHLDMKNGSLSKKSDDFMSSEEEVITRISTNQIPVKATSANEIPVQEEPIKGMNCEDLKSESSKFLKVETDLESPAEELGVDQESGPGSMESSTELSAAFSDRCKPKMLTTVEADPCDTVSTDESIPSDGGHIYYPFVDKDNTYLVNLNKSPSGLGFSVYGGVDIETEDSVQGVVRIKKVFPLGPAKSSGQLERDDVILEVNDKPVKGLTHAEVVSLLHSVVTNVRLLMCRPRYDQLPPLPRSSSEEWMERRASERAAELGGTLSETESEDEPILYRDTLPDRDTVITPPSGFTSPAVTNHNLQQMFVPPPNSAPPPLPMTPPPSLSLQNSPLPSLNSAGMGRWGNFENLRAAVSPRSSCDGDLNSTFNSTLESMGEEESDDQLDKGRQLLALAGKGRELLRSTSSQSEDSQSSTDSIVRSPLKDTYSVGEGTLSVTSDSGLDGILQKNKDHLGTGTNSLQSSDVPTDDEQPSLESPRDSPTVPYSSPRGSPTVPYPSLRDSPTVPCSSSPYTSPRNSPTAPQGSPVDLTKYEQTEENPPDNDFNEEEYLGTGEIEVILIKEEGQGLGFTVTGGVSKGGCFIKAIVQNPALSNGILQAGDKLLKVNEHDLTGLGHTEAVKYLRQTTGEVWIRVFRETVQDHKTQVPTMEQVQKSGNELEETDDVQTGHREQEMLTNPLDTLNSGYEPDSTADTAELQEFVQPDMMKMELDRTRPGGLGFSLVTAEKDNQTGIFIKSIKPNSEAARNGRLHVMDRLVQINGESVVGLTHTKAAQMIRNADNIVTLTVSRLTSRQLEVMTPPVIMYNSDEDDGDECVDEISGDIHQASDDELYDSEDDDMEALVNEAEKLLLSSGTVELTTDTIDLTTDTFNEGNFEIPESYIHNIHKPEKDFSESTGLYDTGSTLGTDEGQEETGEYGETNERNQTFTIVTLQRKLDIDIPDLITVDWLNGLPLLQVQDEVKHHILTLIQQLQQTVEQKNHLEEYKELRQVKTTDDCTVAKLPHNRGFNKFRNILPYDYNRVELSGEKDYINASHILMNVGDSEAHYIAAQGPLPQTNDDFWQMIWEQNVSVVAMLTKDVEKGKVKCHRYWPDAVETPLCVCYGLYKLNLVKVQNLDHFDVREIEIENLSTGKGRVVYHFNFTTWPDQGLPKPVPILQFLQLIHAHHTTGPIIVHCSAGIGRTGAFITIDLALAQIENKGRCDIFEIVTELRRQRYGMIQVKDQYALCYAACLEALQSVSS